MLTVHVRRSVYFLYHYNTFAPFGRRFHGIGQTTFNAFFDNQTVDNNFQIMFFSFSQFNILIQGTDFTVNAYTGKPFFAKTFQ